MQTHPHDLRSDAQASSIFRATVVHSSGTPFHGRVAGLSRQGVSLSFTSLLAPGLAVDEEVELRFSGPWLEKDLVAPAVVRFRKEIELGRVYGFEFRDRAAFRASIPPGLLHFFSQRDETRLSLPAAPRVVLENKLTLLHRASVLHDLSARGACVSVGSRWQSFVCVGEPAKLYFWLPSELEPVSLWGRVVHSLCTGSEMRFGISFDPPRNRDHERMHAVMASYLEDLRSAPRRSA